MSKSRTARGLILVAAAGVLLSLSVLGASSVDAARGGTAAGGGKGGGKPAPTATCPMTVTPSTVRLGASLVVSGSGFVPYQQVTVYRDGAGYGMFADINGNIALTLTSGTVGLHTLTTSKLVNSSWVSCWSGSYEVVS